MSVFAFAPIHFLWLVGAGWLVVLHVRARMAHPDEPPPMPAIHVVTGTINLALIAGVAIYLALP